MGSAVPCGLVRWLASGAAVVLWLLPILCTGANHRNLPLATAWMRQRYRVARLVLDSVKSWDTDG